MPALPTLNLLSLSADGSAGGLSAGAGGAAGPAFQAALSERLSVTDGNAVDAAVPGILMPLELSMPVEALPDGGLLVFSPDRAAAGDPQLSTTAGLEFVEVPVLTPASLPFHNGLPMPVAGAVVEASVPAGSAEAPATTAQIPAVSLPTTAVASTAPLVTAPQSDGQANGDMAGLELLRQAAGPLTGAERGAGDGHRPRAPGAGPLPAAPTLPENVPGSSAAGADRSAAGVTPNPSSALIAGTPPGTLDGAGSDGDWLQQLAAVSDLSRGGASVIQTADTSLEASPVAAWAHVAAPARDSGGAASLTLALNRPVASPEWNQELGERIVWLADNNRQSAELQLNPRELGPLAVRISVVDDVARVAFTAHNAVTREALEAAMPQLKEMLQSQGLSLGEANVSADNAPAGEQAPAGQRGDGSSEMPSDDDAGESAPTAPQTRHDGLFDGYA